MSQNAEVNSQVCQSPLTDIVGLPVIFQVISYCIQPVVSMVVFWGLGTHPVRSVSSEGRTS